MLASLRKLDAIFGHYHCQYKYSNNHYHCHPDHHQYRQNFHWYCATTTIIHTVITVTQINMGIHLINVLIILSLLLLIIIIMLIVNVLTSGLAIDGNGTAK